MSEIPRVIVSKYDGKQLLKNLKKCCFGNKESEDTVIEYSQTLFALDQIVTLVDITTDEVRIGDIEKSIEYFAAEVNRINNRRR